MDEVDNAGLLLGLSQKHITRKEKTRGEEPVRSLKLCLLPSQWRQSLCWVKLHSLWQGLLLFVVHFNKMHAIIESESSCNCDIHFAQPFVRRKKQLQGQVVETQDPRQQ